MFNEPPRMVDSGTLSALSNLVQENQYRIITDPSQLPPELSNYAGTNFLCTVIAGTNCGQGNNNPYSAGGNVWWVKTYRNCNHDGTQHYNADMRMYYKGNNGKPWMASSKDNPDHYIRAINGTTLKDARIAANLPENDIGELDQLGFQSLALNDNQPWPDFDMPYWEGDGMGDI